MPRSMAHPDYVYTPRSAEVRARLSLVHKQRLGIPPDCVRIYGVFVPNEREHPLRYYASYIRQNKGWDAAVQFVRAALTLRRVEKPSPDRRKICEQGYYYKPLPGTIKRRIARLTRRPGCPDSNLSVYGIRVPADRAEILRTHAKRAASRAGRRAAQWIVCEAWANGWPEMEAPSRSRVDFDLVRLMLAEHATVDEVADFLKVTPKYLRLQLKAQGRE